MVQRAVCRWVCADLGWDFWSCLTTLVLLSSAVHSPNKLTRVSGESFTQCHIQEKSENFIYSGIRGTDLRQLLPAFSLPEKKTFSSLVPPSTCCSCARACPLEMCTARAGYSTEAGQEVQGKQAEKTQPNTSHQFSPIPCFCQDCWYLKAAAKPFEQTIFSLKRSGTLCCPFFVGGWHYFFSNSILKNELQKGELQILVWA